MKSGKYSVNPRFFLVNMVLTAGLFFSCGLDEYYYLDQIPLSSIKVTDTTQADFSLPMRTSFSYVDDYVIYYRIYTSNLSFSGTIPTSSSPADHLQDINRSLRSDFDRIYPSTDPLNTSANTAIANLFRSLNYYELEWEDSRKPEKFDLNIQNDVQILFSPNPGRQPTISINAGIPGGRTYTLNRSTNGRVFHPQPDLYFMNHSDLTDPTKATSTINADTAPGVSGSNLTYVSMYIVALGTDAENFTSIYSKPTHIGIFRLPER